MRVCSYLKTQFIISHCDQKRPRSPSPAKEGEIVLLSVDPMARVIARLSSVDLWAGAITRSLADLIAEVLVRSVGDRAPLNPEEAVMRLANLEDLWVGVSSPEDPLESSVAVRQPISAIEDEINNLTEELATFCLNQLENMSSNDVDLDMNAATIEDEHRVRDYIAITW